MGTDSRIERDFLGERAVPAGAYYGIHAVRAAENFAVSGRRLPRSLIRALALIKKAAALAHGQLGDLDPDKVRAIEQACDEMASGRFDAEFIVDPLQGGAGTATNMNANEIVANRACELLGSPLGSYVPVHPTDDVNRGQSTNDVFPTAVRIAAIWELRDLVDEVARLQESLQKKENEFAAILKIGRTQLQDAVPVTLGAEFSAWAEAISRDRWRLYRVEERLRVVNLGGTAVGTGINTSRKFQFEILRILRDETGIGLARADNLVEATQNADVFVEISGLLKPLAVNLSKMASDLRLLASGPRSGLGEIRLPAVQEGSSIMPGKVNPVMCEMIHQIAMKVYGNDLVITHAAEMGQLELNAFLPVIMDVLLESLTMLRRGIALFNDRCVKGIEANEQRCRENLRGSLGLLTVLAGRLGHEAMSQVYQRHLRTGEPVTDILISEGWATAAEIEAALERYRAV
ncbi:MAG: Aspartate ammonia-lyase [Candidatus Ozemobacter sibiricus]|uniref:Aspartate ammonia-lyase n=1 Tax=Candidatus Ozemobacter sibiricus TaxID=2268124 RepID=A0A367ZLP0_9BACT|nr:MAG: Aspartate ammonia-lyase [Candidatus Ozemobacter sibiricus]